MRHRPAPPLRPEEVAAGVPLGLDPVPPLARQGRHATARQALRAVLVDALARPPCLVSFSGGRDSSALLAVAVDVARRHGLPMPVPATLVFPGSPASDEDDWQRLVLDHLGVTERVRIEVTDQGDAVGPAATDALARHGLLWPYNFQFHLPIIEAATGGTVVTGFGGDEIALASETARAERRLTSWSRPHVADALVVGLALSPRPVRTAVHRHRARREVGALGWLTPAGVRAVATAQGGLEGATPLGWEAVIRRSLWRDRYFRVCTAGFDLLGGDHDVRVVHPFVAAPFLDALATEGGFTGFGGRAELLGRLVGDLLPAAVLTRTSKATFSDPLWTDHARRFADQWSGGGVDPDLVDVDRLRQHWNSANRHVMSITLLQQGWLYDHRSGTLEAGTPSAPSTRRKAS